MVNRGESVPQNPPAEHETRKMAEHKRQRRGGGGKERRSGSDRQGFTAFNMDDENDEGHFDADGNFIWDKEEKSVQEEAWLDIVSEDQIEAAKSAKDRKDYRDEQEDENMTEDEANKTLASLLQSRETVLQALQRLGKKRSKARGANNKRKQAGGNGAEDAQTPEEKEQFDRITEAADFLMRIGEVDVYSQMKEEFISEEELLAQRQERQREQQEQEERQQASAASRGSYFNSTGDAAQQDAKTEQEPPADEVMWEYKGADGQIHGPFATSVFIAWRQQGYFIGENAVDMRRVLKSGSAAQSDADKKEEEKKPAVSAEEELMNDFEDSEDDEPDNGGGERKDASENEWKRSDQIDFEALRQT